MLLVWVCWWLPLSVAVLLSCALPDSRCRAGIVGWDCEEGELQLHENMRQKLVLYVSENEESVLWLTGAAHRMIVVGEACMPLTLVVQSVGLVVLGN